MEPDYDLYGHQPAPCDFEGILAELELMSGASVNVIIEEGANSGREILCTRGRLGLPERRTSGERRYFSLGEQDMGFELSESGFVGGKFVPGHVWAQLGEITLIVERRHELPEGMDAQSLPRVDPGSEW